LNNKKEYHLIWFQHLHKSAGTFIVNMAITNGELLFNKHNNGNPTNQEGDLLPIWEYNKIELLDFINRCEEAGVTFVATEYGSPDFEFLSNDPRITLITCIRDPKKRMISNYNYDYYSGYTDEKSIAEFIEVPNVYTSDNYYVRVFSRTTSIPLKKLTEFDFQMAVKNIGMFDITIKTGHNNLEKKLFESFGWDKLSNNNHSTFGDKWRIINLIKRLQFIRLINYIKQKNMVIDESCLNNRFDLDYKLLSMIIDSDVG
jgi:hypothetical protein